MQRTFSLTAAVVSLLLTVLTPGAQAELAPQVYKDMQSRAPEFLEIQVLSVTTAAASDEIRVDVEARVIDVRRSKSGLKAGDVIRIEYTRTTKLLAGPSPAPVLQKGKKYPAFLSQAVTKNDYRPAALGRSFELIR
jgi:hypothetical protein